MEIYWFTQLPLRPTETVVAPTSSPSTFDLIAQYGVILLIVGAVIGVIIFLVRWMVTKKTKAKDIFKQDYSKVVEMCKINKNPKYTKSFMGMPKAFMSSGVPIIINYPTLIYGKKVVETKDEKGKAIDKTEAMLSLQPGQSYKLGSYVGSCYLQDGCWTLLVKSSKVKILGLFPKLFVIKLRLPHQQKTIDSDDTKRTKVRNVPPDNFSESEERIIINCLGVEKVGGIYFYCVNVTDDGWIVDTKPYAYQDYLDISLQKQLMDIGRNMVTIAEDWVKSNPIIQMVRRTEGGLTSE
jgi:hypothetical protein